MSMDFEIWCAKHKFSKHLGQVFIGGNACFGYGSNDEEGRREVADFINFHMECGTLHVDECENVPRDIANECTHKEIWSDTRKCKLCAEVIAKGRSVSAGVGYEAPIVGIAKMIHDKNNKGGRG